MRLPKWIPMVPRPWNPAFRSTWDAMTPNERRWSFLFDVAVVVVALSLIGMFL